MKSEVFKQRKRLRKRILHMEFRLKRLTSLNMSGQALYPEGYLNKIRQRINTSQSQLSALY